jgi:hypothetical protein
MINWPSQCWLLCTRRTCHCFCFKFIIYLLILAQGVFFNMEKIKIKIKFLLISNISSEYFFCSKWFFHSSDYHLSIPRSTNRYFLFPQNFQISFFLNLKFVEIFQNILQTHCASCLKLSNLLSQIIFPHIIPCNLRPFLFYLLYFFLENCHNCCYLILSPSLLA